MNSAIGIGRPGWAGKGRLLPQLALLVAAVGLGAAAGFGIVSAIDGGPGSVTRYRTLAVSEQDYPDFTVYLVRDLAQAEQVDSLIWESLGAAASGFEVPAYRIVIAGTPDAEAVLAQRTWATEAGYEFGLVDLRGE